MRNLLIYLVLIFTGTISLNAQNLKERTLLIKLSTETNSGPILTYCGLQQVKFSFTKKRAIFNCSKVFLDVTIMDRKANKKGAWFGVTNDKKYYLIYPYSLNTKDEMGMQFLEVDSTRKKVIDSQSVIIATNAICD